MNKRTLALALTLVCFASHDCFARGGFSGGGRGGFSGGRSFSSRSYSSPSRSYSSSSRSYTTRTTTVNRYYGGGHFYGRGSYWGGAYWNPFMFGPFGMGYGYSNGLIEGMIIGNLLHPTGTTVYSGGGYGGNALLYPDGRVVDQNGYQVGNYQNNQFVPVQNGQMVAQPAPAQYGGPQQGVPVEIQSACPSAGEIACGVIVGVLVMLIIIAMIA